MTWPGAGPNPLANSNPDSNSSSGPAINNWGNSYFSTANTGAVPYGAYTNPGDPANFPTFPGIPPQNDPAGLSNSLGVIPPSYNGPIVPPGSYAPQSPGGVKQAGTFVPNVGYVPAPPGQGNPAFTPPPPGTSVPNASANAPPAGTYAPPGTNPALLGGAPVGSATNGPSGAYAPVGGTPPAPSGTYSPWTPGVNPFAGQSSPGAPSNYGYAAGQAASADPTIPVMRIDPNPPGYTPSTAIAGGPLYQNYANMANSASGFGQYAGTQLNNPNVSASLSGLGTAAAGSIAPMGQQSRAIGGLAGSADWGNAQQQGASDALARQSQATEDVFGSAARGQAPSAAQIQQQQGIDAAMRQAGSLAGSTRGNFGLANAQKGAEATQAGLAGQASSQGAMLRAQEMAQARGQYGQQLGATSQQAAELAQQRLMAQQAYGSAAQGLTAEQLKAMGLYSGASQADMAARMGYYTGQQQFYGQEAANMGSMGVAQSGIAAGLQGYATQQNIANMQNSTQLAGAGIGATGALLAALL